MPINDRMLIASTLKIYVKMDFFCIICYIPIFDYNGINVVLCVGDTFDGVENGRVAIYRLKMWQVVLRYGNRIDGGLSRRVTPLHKEYVLTMIVAHGEAKTIHVDVSVDKHRIVSVVPVGGDVERVGERSHGSGQLKLTIDPVVEWTIY